MLTNETKTKLFMIEGGPALELIKKHIEDKQRAHSMKVQVLAQLGLDSENTLVWASKYNGAISEIAVQGKLPKGFKATNWTKPDREGKRRPKRGTDEHKILYAKDVGWEPAESLIIDAFNVPTSIAYKTSTGSGFTRIGHMLTSCGFLWLSKNGPYAMWIPDVEACVEEMKERHKHLKSFKFLRGVDTWKLEVEGLRPILQEEWDLLVAQKNLEDAQAKAKFMAAAAAALKTPMPKGVAKAAKAVIKKSKTEKAA